VAVFSKKPQPEPRRVRPVVSSAAHISRADFKRAINPLPWHEEAWGRYLAVGVLKFGVDWLASACSRARLFIGTVDPDGGAEPVPIEDPRYQAVIAAFAGGQTQQSQLITRMTIHISVVGETFLLHVDLNDTWTWVAATASEVEDRQGSRFYLLDDKTRVEISEEDNQVIRIWRPNPVRAWESDSSVRALLPECAQLCALNAHVLASADSRLSGAGILTVPESATIAAATGTDAQQVVDDPFMSTLVENMMRPLEDRSSAAAVVPLVIRVPDSSVAGIKHITTATPFDAQVPDLIEAVTKKIALGLDAPQEVILGLGETNHWNTEAIDAQSVRLHVQPMLQTITSALTAKWLPDALEAAGLPLLPGMVVWADVSDLTQEPDRTEVGIELFKLNAINTSALLRLCGMSDADAPTPQELRHQIMLQLATTPQGAELVGQLLGLPATSSGTSGASAAPAAGSAPQLPAATSTPAPAPPAAGASAGITSSGARFGPETCELAVLRALEVAGKRLLTPALRGRYRDTDAWQLHTRIRPSISEVERIMDGAWDTLTALGASPRLIRCLDTYTRGLITTGNAHSMPRLLAALTPARAA
jgi:hypothetical protein